MHTTTLISLFLILSVLKENVSKPTQKIKVLIMELLISLIEIIYLIKLCNIFWWLSYVPSKQRCPLVWMPDMKSNPWTDFSVVASKKPGGHTLSHCTPEDAWKMAFIPLWIIMSWTSPTTLQTKIFLFTFLHTSSSLGKMKSLLIFFLEKTLTQVLLLHVHDTQQIMMAFLPICKRFIIPLELLMDHNWLRFLCLKLFYVIKDFYQVCVELWATHGSFLNFRK